MNEYNVIYSYLLDHIIDQKVKQVATQKQFMGNFTVTDAKRELKTIHINFGRQTGKTTYIAEHSGENDLIIVSRREFFDRFVGCKGKVIYSLKELSELEHAEFEFVWMDDIIYNPTISYGDIIQTVDASKAFIRLGE